MAKTNIIIDLDGTISFDDHRRHLIPTEGWDAYFNACGGDTPNHSVIALMGLYFPNFQIHILTGRAEMTRRATVMWLGEHKVQYDNLLMRSNDDYLSSSTDSNPDSFRSDEDVKREMLAQLSLTPDNVLMVLDDRDVMIKFWREEGFDAWQVRPEGKLY